MRHAHTGIYRPGLHLTPHESYLLIHTRINFADIVAWQWGAQLPDGLGFETLFWDKPVVM